MLLLLERKYFPNGCNGTLSHNNVAICHTIELPWRDNQIGLSCIPEGKYKIEKRYSQKFKWHLILKNVAGRSFILIHPANDALKELRGCIAPVNHITGPGRGSESRIAMHKLKQLVYRALSKRETVFINIKKE